MRVVANGMLREFDLAALNLKDQCRLGFLCIATFIDAENVDGAFLTTARRLKERVFPKFLGPRRKKSVIVFRFQKKSEDPHKVGTNDQQ